MANQERWHDFQRAKTNSTRRVVLHSLATENWAFQWQDQSGKYTKCELWKHKELGAQCACCPTPRAIPMQEARSPKSSERPWTLDPFQSDGTEHASSKSQQSHLMTKSQISYKTTLSWSWASGHAELTEPSGEKGELVSSWVLWPTGWGWNMHVFYTNRSSFGRRKKKSAGNNPGNRIIVFLFLTLSASESGFTSPARQWAHDPYLLG